MNIFLTGFSSDFFFFFFLAHRCVSADREVIKVLENADYLVCESAILLQSLK